MNIYEEHGYIDRDDYLAALAEEHGDHVYDVAELLGPSEDFDGLLSCI